MAEVADHLVDVTAQTIYNWRNQIDRGSKPGITSKEAAELTAAKKRIRALATELAVAVERTSCLEEQTDSAGGSRFSAPS